ncbi:hypothetical protein [Streptomyces sp. NBC_01373]|uniref:hypothetical protein n=1 Tax=Streptomyces sp. NBC_01373 TaxID=2903843 RepID=UPI0022567467|nr:hypothetical protein [Streptomyces sp. NBC_01373]MCX4705632.1 hypothetical protein [Streptomyces sp. NBC_01373]
MSQLESPTPRTPRHTPAQAERRAELADAASGFDGFPAIKWLRATGVDESETVDRWIGGRLAPLPVGVTWDVVLLPHREGWRVWQQLQMLDVKTGPMLLTNKHMAVFVPTGSADDWDLPGARVLKLGDTVEVPHPSVAAPRTQAAYSWVVPPLNEPVLTDCDDLYGAYAAVCVEHADGAPL